MWYIVEEGEMLCLIELALLEYAHDAVLDIGAYPVLRFFVGWLQEELHGYSIVKVMLE